VDEECALRDEKKERKGKKREEVGVVEIA